MRILEVYNLNARLVRRVAKRRAAIQRMRAHWQKEKETARQYWGMILEHQAAEKRR